MPRISFLGSHRAAVLSTRTDSLSKKSKPPARNWSGEKSQMWIRTQEHGENLSEQASSSSDNVDNQCYLQSTQQRTPMMRNTHRRHVETPGRNYSRLRAEQERTLIGRNSETQPQQLDPIEHSAIGPMAAPERKGKEREATRPRSCGDDGNLTDTREVRLVPIPFFHPSTGYCAISHPF